MRLRRPDSRSHAAAVAPLGLLGMALLCGPFARAEGATLHLRTGMLAIECHWTAEDAVIVTRGGVAIRVPRDQVVRIEEAPPTEPCPAAAPPPTMTLGAPPPPVVPQATAPRIPLAPPPDVPLPAAEASLTEAQRGALADVRRLVNGFVSEYKPPLTVEVVVMPLASTNLASLANVGVSYSLGRLHVDPRMLGAPTQDPLIAKVLALQLAPRIRSAASLDDYQRQQRQQSLEANAKAVEILVRVKGSTEREAVHNLHAWLLALHMKGITPPSGQPTACEQILDLLARFPEHRVGTGGPSCGPPPRAPGSTPARSSWLVPGASLFIEGSQTIWSA